jgi:hypothetical protein
MTLGRKPPAVVDKFGRARRAATPGLFHRAISVHVFHDREDGIGKLPEIIHTHADDVEYAFPVHLVVGMDGQVAEAHCLPEGEAGFFWNQLFAASMANTSPIVPGGGTGRSAITCAPMSTDT